LGYGDSAPVTTVGNILAFFVLLTRSGSVAVSKGLFVSAMTKARAEEPEHRERQCRGDDRARPPKQFTRVVPLQDRAPGRLWLR